MTHENTLEENFDWEHLVNSYHEARNQTQKNILAVVKNAVETCSDQARDYLKRGLDLPRDEENFPNILYSYEMGKLLYEACHAVKKQIDGQIEEQECARKLFLVAYRNSSQKIAENLLPSSEKEEYNEFTKKFYQSIHEIGNLYVALDGKKSGMFQEIANYEIRSI